MPSIYVQRFDAARDMADKCLETKRLLESASVQNARLKTDLENADG